MVAVGKASTVAAATPPDPLLWADMGDMQLVEAALHRDAAVQDNEPDMQGDTSDDDAASQDEDQAEDLDVEAAVIRVMEFLNIRRALAVNLLDMHHGSASR